MLTDASLVAAVDATLGARPVGPDDVLLTPFPLCHVAGYNVMVLHRRARPIVLQPTFDAVGARRHGPRARRHDALARADDDRDAPRPSRRRRRATSPTVRALGYGASPIPGPVLRRVVERWDWDCSQGFGMTELSGNAIFLGPDEHRAAAAGDDRLLVSAGRPAPGVEVRLGDRDELLDPRAAGDARATGTTRTRPRPRSTATAGCTPATSARIDADGIVTIVDRTKDIIVSGGENVASREVEEVLHAPPRGARRRGGRASRPALGRASCRAVVVRPQPRSTADELDRALPRAPRRVQDAAPRRVRRRAPPQRLGQGAEAPAPARPRGQASGARPRHRADPAPRRRRAGLERVLHLRA